MIKILVLTFSLLTLAYGQEKYYAPKLSLKEAPNYSKPVIKREKWAPDSKIESAQTREIASKKDKSRSPSSTKQLFKPWIYKATP